MRQTCAIAGAISLLAVFGVFSGTSGHEHTTKPAIPAAGVVAQKTCPVMGNPIDTAIHVDYQGKRIYFCCNACPAEFGKDPRKYLKVLADKGESVQIVDSVKAGLKTAAAVSATTSATAPKLAPQKTCPIMGGAIDKKLHVDYKGKRIYVCCAGCIDAVKRDPEKALRKLAELGEAAESLPAR